MTYTILALGNENNCIMLANMLETHLKTHGSELNVEYVDVIKEGLPSLLARSKSAHAILMPVSDIALAPVQSKIAKDICKENNLFATYTRYMKQDNAFDFAIVHDSLGGMLCGENGFRNNPNYGREAYCVHSYSELEIEKIARIAYELAEKSHKTITLADLDPHLATSQLWYKILSDINEDYPSISAGCSQMRFAINDIANEPTNLGIVLSDSLTGKALNAVANAKQNVTAFSCSIGDTPLALYAYPKNISQNALEALAKEILSTSLGGFTTDLSF